MTSKLKKPVLTDRSLDLAFAVKFFIFAGFGLGGALSTVPAIAEVAGALYEFLWTISIFIIGSVTALLTLWNIHTDYFRTRFVKWEWYGTILMTGLIATYALALSTLAVQGFERRFSLSIISFALLVFPVWRIRDLFKRLKGRN